MIPEQYQDILNDFYKLRFQLLLLGILIMLQDATAYTDGFNSSLTEFGNFSRADNFLEVTLEINSWVNYMFGNVLLLILGVVYFGVGLLFVNQFSKVFLFTSFSLAITSALLKVVGLVSDLSFYFCLSLLAIALFIIVVKRGE